MSWLRAGLSEPLWGARHAALPGLTHPCPCSAVPSSAAPAPGQPGPGHLPQPQLGLPPHPVSSRSLLPWLLTTCLRQALTVGIRASGFLAVPSCGVTSGQVFPSETTAALSVPRESRKSQQCRGLEPRPSSRCATSLQVSKRGRECVWDRVSAGAGVTAAPPLSLGPKRRVWAPGWGLRVPDDTCPACSVLSPASSLPVAGGQPPGFGGPSEDVHCNMAHTATCQGHSPPVAGSPSNKVTVLCEVPPQGRSLRESRATSAPRSAGGVCGPSVGRSRHQRPESPRPRGRVHTEVQAHGDRESEALQQTGSVKGNAARELLK